ncbi:uncharacterized protein PAC_15840 [Phialocephala subalpina]|uniref:Heterokaryon incompatibility domain-containing protein n=1 Tax=Phialocephala subalpina TaxID=576137 RepID=A0A1L7XLK6_9HELO|nr:uncharacterized protein PAC_15840 [Phialocephala subalpina]
MTQEMAEVFQYRKLEPPDEIRLLHLLPGTANGNIHANILHCPLADLSKCEALSYEWGELTREHGILCNGKTLKVTSNLLAALKRLRQPHVGRLLWIDAICINQDDVTERSHQVGLMGEVYKNAGRVVIWIGEENALTRDAFEVIPRLADSYGTLRLIKIPGIGEFKTGDKIGQYRELDAWPAVLEVLASRTYFSRLWTVQEIALSSEESTIVVCGAQSIEWKAFYAAARYILERNYGLSDTQLNTLGRIVRQSRLQTRFHDPASDRPLSLWSCVIATLRYDVGMPHDRLFALLGMVDEETRSELSHLSYDNSLDQVYGAATKVVVEKEQHLLHFNTIDTVSADRGPSWALCIEFGLTYWFPWKIKEGVDVPELNAPVISTQPISENARKQFLHDLEEIYFRKKNKFAPSQGRNLFRSTTGFIGVGPRGDNGADIIDSAVQKGDKIAIIARTNCPMILRPRDDGCYSVVGVAYVSGLRVGGDCPLTEIFDGVPPLVELRLR